MSDDDPPPHVLLRSFHAIGAFVVLCWRTVDVLVFGYFRHHATAITPYNSSPREFSEAMALERLKNRYALGEIDIATLEKEIERALRVEAFPNVSTIGFPNDNAKLWAPESFGITEPKVEKKPALPAPMKQPTYFWRDAMQDEFNRQAQQWQEEYLWRTREDRY